MKASHPLRAHVSVMHPGGMTSGPIVFVRRAHRRDHKDRWYSHAPSYVGQRRSVRDLREELGA